MNDNKRLVIKKEIVLRDIACYHYPCSRCGVVEFIPQIIAKTFDLLAPKDWRCVSQNDARTYYCRECSAEIGIGVL